MNRMQRKKYTKQIIKNSFLKIKEKKALSDITITELCKKAEISRPTFYKYYNNTLDVLDNILEDIYDTCYFPDEVPSLQEPKNTDYRKYPLCKLIREHNDLHGIFLDESLNQHIIDFLLHHKINCYEKEQLLFFQFQMHGCFSVIQKSIHLPEKEWNEAINQTHEIVKYSLKLFQN